MHNRAFCNTDGDMLICPQEGNLDVQTEFGLMFVQPGEIFVIPRGVRFLIRLAPQSSNTNPTPENEKVEGANPGARGYITEIWGSSWELPDLGPIGGHGLANPRDFLVPVAHIDELEELHANWEVVCKLNGKLEAIGQDHSPFDLVAWHGNVVPYKVSFVDYFFALCSIPRVRLWCCCDQVAVRHLTDFVVLMWGFSELISGAGLAPFTLLCSSYSMKGDCTDNS